jgi:hypothetical protein
VNQFSRSFEARRKICPRCALGAPVLQGPRRCALQGVLGDGSELTVVVCQGEAIEFDGVTVRAEPYWPGFPPDLGGPTGPDPRRPIGGVGGGVGGAGQSRLPQNLCPLSLSPAVMAAGKNAYHRTVLSGGEQVTAVVGNAIRSASNFLWRVQRGLSPSRGATAITHDHLKRGTNYGSVSPCRDRQTEAE